MNTRLAIMGMLLAGGAASAQTPTQTDEAAIHGVVKQLVDGWNAHDGKAFAAPFAPDADYVVINGSHIHGRDAIEQGHTGIFASMYAKSTNAGAVDTIRYLKPDIALVHATFRLTPAPGVPEETAMTTILMARSAAGWSIASYQITPILAQPVRR